MVPFRLSRRVGRQVWVTVRLPRHHRKAEGSIPLDDAMLGLRVSRHTRET